MLIMVTPVQLLQPRASLRGSKRGGEVCASRAAAARSSAPSDAGNGFVGMPGTTAARSAEPQPHSSAWRKSLDLQGRAQAEGKGEGPREEHRAGEREINP